METDPTTRTLELLGLLQARASWPAQELARRLGASPRTVRRDVARLRGMGYQVVARPGPGSSYQLVPGLSVPPLLFTADEITAVVAGLRLVQTWLPAGSLADSALAKLDQVLPRAMRRRAAATDLVTEVLAEPDPGATAATVGAIADAVAEEGRLGFDYTDQHGVRSRRVVEPFRHVLRGGHAYLVGFDVDRADWRTFRLDRVHEVSRLPGRFPARPFPAATVGEWFETDFGRAR